MLDAGNEKVLACVLPGCHRHSSYANDMKILSLVPSVADLRIKIFGSESCSFLSFFLANSDPHPF